MLRALKGAPIVPRTMLRPLPAALNVRRGVLQPLPAAPNVGRGMLRPLLSPPNLLRGIMRAVKTAANDRDRGLDAQHALPNIRGTFVTPQPAPLREKRASAAVPPVPPTFHRKPGERPKRGRTAPAAPAGGGGEAGLTPRRSVP